MAGRGVVIHRAPGEGSSSDMGACCPDLDRVERLARVHERVVALAAAEHDFAADLGQPEQPV